VILIEPLTRSIADLQPQLLRLTQACEEPEFFVIAKRLTPLGMRSRNDRFGFVEGEEIDLRALLLADAKCRKRASRIELPGKILVPEFKGRAYRADHVVVSLLLGAWWTLHTRMLQLYSYCGDRQSRVVATDQLAPREALKIHSDLPLGDSPRAT